MATLWNNTTNTDASSLLPSNETMNNKGYLANRALNNATKRGQAANNLDDVTKANTGAAGLQKAQTAGMTGANALGQTASNVAQGAAVNAGMTRGQAAAIGGNVANEAEQNNIASETNAAMKKNAEEIQEAQNKYAEATEQAKMKASEKAQSNNNMLSGAGTGAAMGFMFGGPVGAVLGGLGGGVLGKLFSDERLKYTSKIKNKRIYELQNK